MREADGTVTALAADRIVNSAGLSADGIAAMSSQEIGRPTRTSMRPPGGVWRTALSSRFSITRPSRSGSP